MLGLRIFWNLRTLTIVGLALSYFPVAGLLAVPPVYAGTLLVWSWTMVVAATLSWILNRPFQAKVYVSLIAIVPALFFVSFMTWVATWYGSSVPVVTSVVSWVGVLVFLPAYISWVREGLRSERGLTICNGMG